MTGRAAREADPTVCTDCGHPVDLHRSTGCLYLLGAGCPCPHDMRHLRVKQS